MEFVLADKGAKRKINGIKGIAVVAALHVGLIYVLMNSLNVPIVHPKEVIDFFYVAPPKPVEPPPQPKQIEPKTKPHTAPTMPKPLDPPPPMDDTPKPSIDPVDPTTIVDPGPPAPIDPGPGTGTSSQATGQPAVSDAAVACSNYEQLRTDLSDKLPQVADREGFGERGISRFGMIMQFTLGTNGEIKAPAMLSNTNGYAAHAMQPAVMAGLRRLKCAGQGHEVAVQVPLNFTFTLTDA